MNVALPRMPSISLPSFQIPNVRLPFFTHTSTGDQVTLAPPAPRPMPPTALRPSVPVAQGNVRAQAQAINAQTQAAISKITLQSHVLGHTEIQAITRQLDNAQARLSALAANASPQDALAIQSTLADIANARQTYVGIDTSSAAADKQRQAIRQQAAADVAAGLKQSADAAAKAFTSADDAWRTGEVGGSR